ncbi:MAG: 5-formyltetrahydrofolate cyclo-ligase [Porphyromonadaceae bacterium]|nr:5-formyltetrahydrofolate cyclo-ligase [Porphyromonadaceae bacterium]
MSRLSLEEKVETAAIIRKRIEALPLFEKARTLLLFHSLPDEVCTHEWIREWCKIKNVLLPAVSGEVLTVRPYDAQRPLQKGRFGIAEPTGEEITDLSVIDLAIIPGVGFDSHGNRLGRGKGFYDKLLVKISAPLIGVAYDCQIVDDIPTLPHDIPMSLIISKNTLFYSKKDIH